MTKLSANRESQQSGDLAARLDALAVIHRIPHEGRDVAWRQFGNGPPLVLIHGGHGSWMHWVRNIEALSTQHTLWLPDLPGFGDSDSLAGEHHAADCFERLVAAVAATADHVVGADREFSLAGFSFGGLVAACLAAKRPKVARLALLGPAGHGGPRRQTSEMVNWRQDDREKMLAALRHNLRALMLHEESSINALAMAVHERACMSTRFRSRALSRQAMLADALATYRGATLLMWGEHDVTAVPVEAAQTLADNASNRDWCLIPGAGHWVQFERHQEVNQLLRRWFAQAELA
ncbi:MAG: alpha/beta fold hydrolase [Pseudomonadales bacterium]